MKQLLFALYISTLLIACNSVPNESNDVTTEAPTSESTIEEVTEENIAQTQEPEKEQIISVQTDSMYFDSLITNLKGIEFFASNDNYAMLISLLEHKGDSANYKKAKAFVDPKNQGYFGYIIKKIDSKNGYIEYIPRQTDGYESITYWNLKDGSQLIAKVVNSCATICDCNIYFSRYENGLLKEVSQEDYLLETEELNAMLIEKSGIETSDDEPLEFEFFLPQKGKSIKYCLSENCIELKWEDEIFKVVRD